MVHQRHEDVPDEHRVNRTGEWMPGDHRVHEEWLSNIIEHVDQNPKELHPVLKEFQALVATNSRVRLLITSMFEEVPVHKRYSKDAAGHPRIRDAHHMLQVLNHVLTSAPRWADSAARAGLVGVPINAVLDWPMGTPSGYAAFLDPDVNAMIKKVLDVWGDFLRSPASAESCLGDDSEGWFGPVGKSDVTVVANAAVGTQHKFEEIFQCDPSKKYHGFTSWDDFFTRLYRDGIRPVAMPEDNNIIANACESRPFATAYNCKLIDKFWLKGQPYSISDMLGHDKLAEQFDGGTVYQAFLSALSYHRWHAPVSGRIVHAFVQPGTYYSEPLWEGIADPHGKRHPINPKSEDPSQGYLTAMATRGIIFIEADNPAIGLMAFIGVGMVEVSTCDITVKEGDHVKKGDQLGMFHFGGSTHCLLFRKSVDVRGFPQKGRKENFPVRSQLAVVHGTK